MAAQTQIREYMPFPSICKSKHHLQVRTGKKRLWREKKLMTYWALKHKRYDDAYNLTLHHGFDRGLEFS